MTNSYGFNGEFPEGAIAGEYDYKKGEWTGKFFFTRDEIEDYAAEQKERETLGIELL